VVGWVALIVLVDVVEPNLGCLFLLFGHPWRACTSGAEVFVVSIHFLVEEVVNPSLGVGDFHNENTT